MSLEHSFALGVDVSKSFLDLSGVEGKPCRFSNDAEGFGQMLQHLSGQPRPGIIVFEATGGYERQCVRALEAQGFPVAVVNPTRVRDFARACGTLAKTDRLDAKLLARFGQVMQIEPRASKPIELRNLESLLLRRGQLVEMQTAERNRRLMAEGVMARAIDRSLGFLAREVDKLDRQINQCIQTQPAWREKVQRLGTIKGVGVQTRAWLIAALPELGKLNRKQLAKLVGIAPFAKDSGQFKGKRRIAGGRATVRTALYMASLTAVQHEPRFREQYQALLARGKAKKAALIACARKLLTNLNAMLRDGADYRPAAMPS